LGYNYQSTEEPPTALPTGQDPEPVSLGDKLLSAIYRQMVRGGNTRRASCSAAYIRDMLIIDRLTCVSTGSMC
jgi:hypothetical protein